MAEHEKESGKESGITDLIKDGLSYISRIILASIFLQISEGAQMVMKNTEDRIMRIEKRIIRRISTLLIIGFGAVFLIFSLFFFLTDYLGWSNAAASFSIGIAIFVTGLLLKIGENNLGENNL